MIYVNIQTFTYIYIYIHMFICQYEYTYIYIYMYMYIYVEIYLCMDMCVYIYTYTHNVCFVYCHFLPAPVLLVVCLKKGPEIHLGFFLQLWVSNKSLHEAI